MTTGAYQDAVKAYENADTVEPTSHSAFQRFRCACAVTDLKLAQEMVNQVMSFEENPDTIFQFDSLCIDSIITISSSVKTVNSKSCTPADIKAHDKALTKGIKTLTELIKTYSSDKLLLLKKKDANLNI